MTWSVFPRALLASSVMHGGCGWLTGLALIALPLWAELPPQVSSPIFKIQSGSRVRIIGHATLGNWECESTEMIATVEPGPDLATFANAVGQGARMPSVDAKMFRAPHALITIPVASLQCNKPGMRDEVLRALRSDDAPLIVFTLTAISEVILPTGDLTESGSYRVVVRGDLVLAGKLRTIELATDVVQESARRFHVDAVKELRMSDFAIMPPHAAFGLIRTDDKVTVNFNLIFELAAPTAAVAPTPLP